MTTPMQHRRIAEHYRDQAVRYGDMVDSFSEAVSLAGVHATIYQADMMRAQVLATIGGRDAEIEQLLAPYDPAQPLPRDIAESIENPDSDEDFTPSYPPEQPYTEAFDG